MKMQPPRGTRDILPEEARQHRHIEKVAFEKAQLFGYGEIRSPIFEFKDVFHRTLGDSSDIVSKETYTFEDRGGEVLTLRPEGTAGVARAFISEGLAQHLPLKLIYAGPMFRYERPQKGRYRQFQQIGIECLGIESHIADIEGISFAFQFLNDLGLDGKFTLEINTLGDPESRQIYKDKLVAYLNLHKDKLSADSLVRLEKNPLRILDSKDAGDREILKDVPKLSESLNEYSQKFFEQVTAGLSKLNIPFTLNEKLVRGLDYYNHTVFEFTTTLLGSQSAIVAGGRYDGLIELMGGPKTAGFGWAAGVDRLAELLDKSLIAEAKTTVGIISADESTELTCIELAHELRLQNISCEFITGGNVGKKMKKAAEKIQCTFAVIIGENEMSQNMLTVKNLKDGQQASMSKQEFFEKASKV